MIRYFRSLLLSRLLSLVLLFLAIRIPLVFWGVPLTLPELKEMVLGERMANGYLLYRDIFDSEAPLAAGIYWLIDLLAGRSLLVYRLLPIFLILIQALRLNSVFNRHNVHPDRTYLPALLYLVASSVFFELDTLTPLLLGMTFVIFSLNYLISFSKEGENNRQLFKAGFILGLGALCYLPLVLFLVIALFAIILFASSSFRSSLLLICGFIFPYSVVLTYYLYTGSITNFLDFHLLPDWNFQVDFLLVPVDVLKILALPLVFLIFTVLHTITHAPGLNYQAKILQLMLVWLPVAVVIAIIGKKISTQALLLFLPALAYYGTSFFLQIRKAVIRETFFLVFFSGVILLRFLTFLGWVPFFQIKLTDLLVNPAPKYAIIQDKNLLVLNRDLNYYQYNRLTSPYLNWDIAKNDFNELDTYQAVFKIYQNIATHYPDYIVADPQLMRELQYKIPNAFGAYQAVTNNPQVFQRIK
ncbi:hypothetical protein [Adhaeribacter pallidiroseus]|uniref:Glycosyltransferase RgtA/B/C/D-like domain-containing protein n=1 Tax=Adhaeribacter pallidiroseus TaxID=2072847 RepID=A0A369QSE7_9BACT|nr:hypothetical protein [Adhaeribacter pallidiroseus]RDC65739.1 hypothetical protein AHMF7616_04369 [Adhaeribacter pallidiroseus]